MKNELYRDNLRDAHWIGEVVENQDPLLNGRCRVRVFGKFDKLPVETIPWASPMNRDLVGSHYVPRIGDIVAVRFENGDIYHPEYWFQVNQNEDLKNDVLLNTERPHDVVSLVYDAERNVRIYWSPEDGLVMTTGESQTDSPMIRFSNDGEIFLNSDRIYIAESGTDTTQPAVRGEALRAVLDQMLDFIKNHTHLTPDGPTQGAMPPVSIQVTALRGLLDNNRSEGRIKQEPEG